jgi:predicted enzyme related to lactoylglutathione lyase
MLDDQRPGTVYWIDHYVVPTRDTARWGDFYTKVFGAVPRANEGRPDRGESTLFTWVGLCHVGGGPHRNLTPGSGQPKYSWFVRPQDVDEHLRRLDGSGVAHTDPIRTSELGEDGTAIRFSDPDGNSLEFWAPARMPEGAMLGESSAKVGRVAAATFESRDLGKTTDFYSRYCGLDPLQSADVAGDTVVFPFAGAGRLVFKRVDQLGNRTLGHAVYRAMHTAMVVRDKEFMPAMERMWAELPEWDFDPDDLPTLTPEQAGALPPRTCIHGSPIGPEWKRRVGRGDSFCDGDTNGFHFVAGAPVGGSMVAFEGVGQRVFLEAKTGGA